MSDCVNYTAGGNTDSVWWEMLRKVLEHGSETHPRGFNCLEVSPHTSCIPMSWPIVTCAERKLGYRFMAAEAWWILSGRNDVASLAAYSKENVSFSNDGIYFDGAYGPMVVDQLRYVVDSLEADQDTRQAVMTIWRRNPRPSRDIPCTISIQWMIRDGLLHCYDTMRSSDLWLGWPYDVFNFSCLSALILLHLKRRSAAPNAVGLGNLYLSAGSEHLYERNFDAARSIATGNVYTRPYGSIPVGQMTHPDQLIEWLRKAKDRQIPKAAWLGEFLGSEDVPWEGYGV